MPANSRWDLIRGLKGLALFLGGTSSVTNVSQIRVLVIVCDTENTVTNMADLRII